MANDSNFFLDNLNQPTGKENIYNVDSNKYGSNYSSVVGANPYANLNYRKSFWQNVLTGLGFRTNYDAYKESMMLQAQEYDAQMAQKAYNEKYDSALEQTQRLREAGINPDVAGDVEAGSAQGPVDDGNPPIAPSSDGDFLTNVAGSLFSGVETLFGLAESGFGLISLGQDIRGKRLDNDKKQIDNTLEAFLSASLPDDYNIGENSDGHKWHFRFGYDKNSRLYALLGNRAKKYAKGVNLFRDSLLGQEEEAKHREGRAKNRSAFARVRGKSTYSEMNDVLDAFEGTLGDLATIAETTTQEKDIKQNKYEGELADAMDAERMAKATMEGAEADVANTQANSRLTNVNAKIQEAREKAKNSLDALTSKLDAMAGDNFLARLGSILVQLIKVRVFQL